MIGTEYIPVARKINSGESGPGFFMEGHDETYPVPHDWLGANAATFHFTNAEIIEAQSDCMRQVPNCPGIYFLILDDRITYVGLSKNMSKRLKAHYANGMRWTGHAWFEAPPVHLTTIECYYIYRISPPCNTQYPPRHLGFEGHIKKAGLDQFPAQSAFNLGNSATHGSPSSSARKLSSTSP